MGPYNAGPESALFLQVALIKAGVGGAGVIRAILKREYLVFEMLSFFEVKYIASLALHPFLLSNFMKNIPI